MPNNLSHCIVPRRTEKGAFLRMQRYGNESYTSKIARPALESANSMKRIPITRTFKAGLLAGQRRYRNKLKLPSAEYAFPTFDVLTKVFLVSSGA